MLVMTLSGYYHYTASVMGDSGAPYFMAPHETRGGKKGVHQLVIINNFRTLYNLKMNVQNGRARDGSKNFNQTIPLR